MRLHRFYIEEDLAGRDEIALREEAVIHQLRDVFRLSAGDKVILYCGDGFDYVFDIKMLSKKEVELVKESSTKNFIPTKKVTLLMSLIKKDNFEMVLEKCTELGVTHFVPVMTERVQKKNIDMNRAHKIVREASEQCGRGDVPNIGEVAELNDVLNDYENIIAFDITGDMFEIRSTKSEIRNKSETLNEEKEMQILIGPEGGWSERELQMFKDKNVKIFKLGDTTLRAETAAIVAAALVMSCK